MLREFVGLTRDIPEGHHKSYDLFDEHLLVKNTGGKFTLHDNKCPHRGFKMVDGCESGEIVCPYHGRKFDPNASAHSVDVQGELIFMAPPETSYEDRIPDLPLGEEFGANKMTVNAPFYLWVQNTADHNHLKYVHPDTFHRLFSSSTPTYVHIGKYMSYHHLQVEPDTVTRYRELCKINPELGSDKFTHYLLYPHLSITSFLGIFFSIETAIPHPDDDNKCVVHTRFFTNKDLEVPQLLKSLALTNNMKILAEDRQLMNRWAESYDISYLPRWMSGESRIRHYMEFLNKAGMFK